MCSPEMPGDHLKPQCGIVDFLIHTLLTGQYEYSSPNLPPIPVRGGRLPPEFGSGYLAGMDRNQWQV
jgi:hypothetical protein